MKDKEELMLEETLFGDLDGYKTQLYDFGNENSNSPRLDHEEPLGCIEDLDDGQLFFVDSGKQVDRAPSVSSSSSSDTEEKQDYGWEPIWDDSDDDKLIVSLASSNRMRKLRKTELDDEISGKEYSKRLRSQYERIYPVPQWAKARKKDDESSENEIPSISSLKHLFQTSEKYVTSTTSSVLPVGHLNIVRMVDANIQAPSQAVVQSVSFHPVYPILMTGGFDRTLRLFHIDGKVNPLASSIYLSKLAVSHASFHPDGRRVFVGGRRKFFYIWDLESSSVHKVDRSSGNPHLPNSMEHFRQSPCGKYIGMCAQNGWVNVLAADTGQWITGAKIEGVISQLVWYYDGSGLCICNNNGEIWEWSMGERRFTSRWKDYGGVATTQIALGGYQDQWCAIGSNSGIVNVYDRKSLSQETNPKPTKTLGQLTTPINCLEFSPDGQILAMSSRGKKDKLRMIHLPSCSVFKNWPTSSTPLGRVSSLAFSPHNEMITVGNEQGRAGLWKLQHYSS